MKLYVVYARSNGSQIGVWHQVTTETPQGFTTLAGSNLAIANKPSKHNDCYYTKDHLWQPVEEPDFDSLPNGPVYRVEISVLKDGEKIAMAGGDVTAENFVTALPSLQKVVNDNWTEVNKYAMLADDE